MAIFRWPGGWSPFGTMRQMHSELERLMGRGGYGHAQRIGGGVYPPVNVLNGPEDMIVQCEIAGVAREDIDLSITGETLQIKGVKHPSADEGEVQYQRRERGAGDFSRTIVLPDKVDPDQVDASLVDGVLTIRLPKSEAARPKQIPVSQPDAKEPRS